MFMSSFAFMKIDKKKLLENFKDIKNIANLNLLKCVNVLFSKKGILTNVGFYIYNSIIIFHAIIFILFYKKKLFLLIDKIKSLIIAIKYLKSKKDEVKEKNKEQEKVKEKKEEIINIEFKNKKEKEIKENIIRFNKSKDNNIINDDNNFVNEVVLDLGKIQIKRRRKKNKKKRYIIVKREKGTGVNNNNNIDNSKKIININLNSNNNIITDGYNKKEFEIPQKQMK